MAKYETFTPRTFPGMRKDGSLGNRYEIPFSVVGLVERDSVIVDELDPKVIDAMIQAKITQYESLKSLGK